MPSYEDAHHHVTMFGFFSVDATDSDVFDQFRDPTTGLPRNPANSANCLNGSETWEVVLKSNAADFLANDGAGGDADAGSNSGDATSPGQWADDYSGTDPGLTVLQSAYTRWVNSDASNTITTGAVETWNDLGSEGNDATQSTSTQRPTDNTSYADFDGTDDELNIASPGTNFANPFYCSGSGGTAVFVFYPDAAASASYLYDHGLGERVELNNESGGACDIIIQMRYQLASHTFETTSTAVTIGAINILFVRYTKTTGTAVATVNINGTSELTIGSGLTETGAKSGNVTGSGSAVSIGGWNGAGGRNYNGRVYEAAFWLGELSDSDLNDVGTYLASTYSGTWS